MSDPEGNVLATRSNVASSYSRGNLYLFSVAGTTNYGASMRLYGLKFWKSGVLAANYIPALDANGVACLYETVGARTIYSSSANVLIAGAITEKSGELTVASANYDGANLGGALTRSSTGSSEVCALIGSEYGTLDTNSWERIELLDPSFVGDSVRIGYYLSNLGNARYVRFRSVKDGWSRTVFLPELQISEDPNTILTAGGIASVGATSIVIDGTVVSRGTGATTCSLIAEYGTEEGVFDQNVVLAQDLLGHGEFTIRGLTPLTAYWVRLRAVNDIEGNTLDPLVFTATTTSRGMIAAAVTPAAGDDARFFTQCSQTDLATGERVLKFSVTTTNASSVVAEPATLTITQPGYAEPLVVGGGGGHDDPTYSGFGGGDAGGCLHMTATISSLESTRSLSDAVR